MSNITAAASKYQEASLRLHQTMCRVASTLWPRRSPETADPHHCAEQRRLGKQPRHELVQRHVHGHVELEQPAVAVQPEPMLPAQVVLLHSQKLAALNPLNLKSAV